MCKCGECIMAKDLSLGVSGTVGKDGIQTLELVWQSLP